MPAVIPESEIRTVIELLSNYENLDDRTIPSDLDAEEVAMISKHRRERLLRQLENKGIRVQAAPIASVPDYDV